MKRLGLLVALTILVLASQADARCRLRMRSNGGCAQPTQQVQGCGSCQPAWHTPAAYGQPIYHHTVYHPTSAGQIIMPPPAAFFGGGCPGGVCR